MSPIMPTLFPLNNVETLALFLVHNLLVKTCDTLELWYAALGYYPNETELVDALPVAMPELLDVDLAEYFKDGAPEPTSLRQYLSNMRVPASCNPSRIAEYYMRSPLSAGFRQVVGTCRGVAPEDARTVFSMVLGAMLMGSRKMSVALDSKAVVVRAAGGAYLQRVSTKHYRVTVAPAGRLLKVKELLDHEYN